MNFLVSRVTSSREQQSETSYFSTVLGSRDEHPDVAKELNYLPVPHI